jgi:hypothetical protein
MQLDVADTTPGFNVFDEWATVSVQDRTPWVGGVGPHMGLPGAPTECRNCVTRTAEVELEVVQKRFDFFFFPFDTQRLRARFTVEGAYLFTCGNLSALRPMFGEDVSTARAQDLLLPFTKQWLLTGTPRQSISMRHPVINGATDYSQCELQLIIRREYTVYFFKGPCSLSSSPWYSPLLQPTPHDLPDGWCVLCPLL